MKPAPRSTQLRRAHGARTDNRRLMNPSPVAPAALPLRAAAPAVSPRSRPARRLPRDQPGDWRAPARHARIHQAAPWPRRLDTGLASYPATAGEPTLREACAAWMQRRYGLELNPATQVLPVNGSREALFALAQTVIDPARAGRHRGAPQSVLPDLRGRGAAGGRQPYYAPSDPARNFAWTGTACPRRLGPHAVAVRVLAGQPHRRRHAAGRMAEALRTATATGS
jgi:hypothetical protein